MVFKCLKYNGGEGELVAIVIRVVKMTSKLKIKMQRVQIQLQIAGTWTWTLVQSNWIQRCWYLRKSGRSEVTYIWHGEEQSLAGFTLGEKIKPYLGFHILICSAPHFIICCTSVTMTAISSPSPSSASSTIGGIEIGAMSTHIFGIWLVSKGIKPRSNWKSSNGKIHYAHGQDPYRSG